MPDRFRSIALINPLTDFGINEYTYELAEGLCANGIKVDVYSSAFNPMAGFPRRHRLFPVLGSPLFRQRALVARRQAAPLHPRLPPIHRHAHGRLAAAERPRIVERLRRAFLPFELALHLRRRRYDLVWTQWPFMGSYGTRLYQACRSLGLPLAHTVHNVLPHEIEHGDLDVCREVYGLVDALVVHSEYSRRELALLMPSADEKTVVAPHGIYDTYPRRPERRPAVRRELGIADDQPVILMFGALRPYKNVDAVLEAMRDDRLARAVLIVAGRERKFPDLVPGDLVGRTRRLAEHLGVLDRVRPLPGPFDHERTAELFEASDVAVLPYIKSYGSGQLMLAMTFGKHIVATETGGTAEYFRRYPRHTLLRSPAAGDVADGLASALDRLGDPAGADRAGLEEFAWPNVARHTLDAVGARLARQAVARAG